MFEMGPLEARAYLDAEIMAIEAESAAVGSIEEQLVEAGGRSTPVRLYRPGKGEFPALVLIHGAGFVAGSLDTHDNLARYLCANAKVIVASVGYTNAPEGKFPLPLEQCYDVLVWAKTIGADGRVAVAGDSAGGTMAAALCLLARDRSGPPIDLQVLINPAPDLRCGGTLEPQGDVLDELRWPATMYVNSPKDTYNPYVSPMAAEDFSGLPPALVLLAEFDSLRKDGQLYADKLAAAGVPTEVYCQMGVGHLAGDGARASSVATESLDVAVDAIRRIQRL